MERQEITREDIDRLVTLGESDPAFRKTFQELDQLASKRGIPLSKVIETACALYEIKKSAREWNQNRIR